MNTHLFICLPILNEAANLPKLIRSLNSQSYSGFSLIACVNQPNEWWDDQTKTPQCIDNKSSLDFLSKIKDIDTTIIDKSTQGNGWIAKKRGVGWARKLTMDLAAQRGKPTDIIITIDADTHYPSEYFQSVVDIFKNHPNVLAHSNPYYHPLSGKRKEDEAILRYELYMRIYALNMLLIHNPYAFSAIGSGMACTVKEYIRLDGM
ncbi:MAG: glycosyltransferase, partial [Bacteroidales bacterium]|nr:glycosyltransferase [Bacteroidales bacterium]